MNFKIIPGPQLLHSLQFHLSDQRRTILVFSLSLETQHIDEQVNNHTPQHMQALTLNSSQVQVKFSAKVIVVSLANLLRTPVRQNALTICIPIFFFCKGNFMVQLTTNFLKQMYQIVNLFYESSSNHCIQTPTNPTPSPLACKRNVKFHSDYRKGGIKNI